MIYAILLALGAALIYLVVQMRAGADWAPKAIVGLTAVTLLVSVGWWCSQSAPDPGSELAAAATADEVLAREVAAAFAKHVPKGRSVVVFAIPADPDARQWMLNGLKKGLEPHGLTLAAIAPPIVQTENDPRGSVGGFDAVLARHPKAGGVIIYGSPEADMEGIEQGGRTDLPLAIVSQRLSPKEAIQRVKDRTATVVSVVRPNIDWMAIKDVKDPTERFHKIRLIITPDNVAEVENQMGR